VTTNGGYAHSTRISSKGGEKLWQQRRKQRKRRDNDQVLGFLLSPGPLPQAGLFLARFFFSTPVKVYISAQQSSKLGNCGIPMHPLFAQVGLRIFQRVGGIKKMRRRCSLT
jgi:hypothetical protein